jgi:hypothetical protein
VDISSPSFLGCTPLLELPPAAAAAYLGTYLMSFLEGLKFQEESVIFYDVMTRAHLLSCLENEHFWRDTIHPHLSAACRRAVAEFCALVFDRRQMVGLSDNEADRIVELSG